MRDSLKSASSFSSNAARASSIATPWSHTVSAGPRHPVQGIPRVGHSAVQPAQVAGPMHMKPWERRHLLGLGISWMRRSCLGASVNRSRGHSSQTLLVERVGVSPDRREVRTWAISPGEGGQPGITKSTLTTSLSRRFSGRIRGTCSEGTCLCSPIERVSW